MSIVFILHSSYGEDPSPALLYDVVCSSSYLTILQCSYSTTVNYCDSEVDYDATVSCCKDIHVAIITCVSVLTGVMYM